MKVCRTSHFFESPMGDGGISWKKKYEKKTFIERFQVEHFEHGKKGAATLGDQQPSQATGGKISLVLRDHPTGSRTDHFHWIWGGPSRTKDLALPVPPVGRMSPNGQQSMVSQSWEQASQSYNSMGIIILLALDSLNMFKSPTTWGMCMDQVWVNIQPNWDIFVTSHRLVSSIYPKFGPKHPPWNSVKSGNLSRSSP